MVHTVVENHTGRKIFILENILQYRRSKRIEAVFNFRLSYSLLPDVDSIVGLNDMAPLSGFAFF